MGALAHLSATQVILRKTGLDGAADNEASAALVQRLHEDFVESLVGARRALAEASPLCPEIIPYISRWPELQSAEVATEVQNRLQRGLHKSLRYLKGTRLRDVSVWPRTT
jgi:hypothetical protein